MPFFRDSPMFSAANVFHYTVKQQVLLMFLFTSYTEYCGYINRLWILHKLFMDSN